VLVDRANAVGAGAPAKRSVGESRTRGLEDGVGFSSDGGGLPGTTEAALSLSKFLDKWAWNFDRIEGVLFRRAQAPEKLSQAERKVFTPDLLKLNWRWLRFRARLSWKEEESIRALFARLLENEALRRREIKRKLDEGRE
jgi:hypothetical protein